MVVKSGRSLTLQYLSASYSQFSRQYSHESNSCVRLLSLSARSQEESLTECADKTDTEDELAVWRIFKTTLSGSK